MGKIKCMSMDVYRHMPWVETGYDPSNGGVTSKYDEVYIPCENGYLDVDEDDPQLMKVVFRDVFGRTVVHLEPMKAVPAGHVGWMNGGCFASSSDSRVSDELHGFYGAVAIHDRCETYELYEALSR